MGSMLRYYNTMLAKRPALTMSTTTATLMAAGDVISQMAIERRTLKTYEIKRTGRFFLFGFVVIGPTLRIWYKTLDRIVPAGASYPGIRKMLIDQICFAPCFLAFFLTSMTFWRTYSFEAVKQNLNKDYLTVLITNYKLWPAAQAINFTFVPLQHRVIFANGVSLIWNTFLSYVSNS